MVQVTLNRKVRTLTPCFLIFLSPNLYQKLNLQLIALNWGILNIPYALLLHPIFVIFFYFYFYFYLLYYEYFKITQNPLKV